MLRGGQYTYTEEMGKAICDLLSDGESLVSICSTDGFPTRPTVMNWLKQFPEFATKYAQARINQADALFDDVLSLADNTCEGTKTVTETSAAGAVVTKEYTGDMLEHRKLQIETRKWIAGRIMPKKYGDRVVQEHVGADGGPIASTTTVTNDPVEAARIYQRVIRGEE